MERGYANQQGELTMNKQYISVMVESLEKKLQVLEKIYQLCQKQTEVIEKEPVDFEEFDRYMDEKDDCIQELDKLDEGFETLYNRVGQELKENKSLYAEQIRCMQQTISEIMAKSASIQALEERNKRAVEATFAKERREIGRGKRSLSVAMNYYRNMRGGADAMEPQYMDKKK